MICPSASITSFKRIMIPLAIKISFIPKYELTSTVKLTVFEITKIWISLLVYEHSITVRKSRLKLTLIKTPISFASSNPLTVHKVVHLPLIFIFQRRINICLAICVYSTNLMCFVNALNKTLRYQLFQIKICLMFSFPSIQDIFGSNSWLRIEDFDQLVFNFSSNS